MRHDSRGAGAEISTRLDSHARSCGGVWLRMVELDHIDRRKYALGQSLSQERGFRPRSCPWTSTFLRTHARGMVVWTEHRCAFAYLQPKIAVSH